MTEIMVLSKLCRHEMCMLLVVIMYTKMITYFIEFPKRYMPGKERII